MVRRWRAATPLLRRTLPRGVRRAWSRSACSRRSSSSAARSGRVVRRRPSGCCGGCASPGIAGALWLGLMRRRLLVGEVLGRLAARLSNGVDACRLREVLRAALAIRRSRCWSRTAPCAGSTATGTVTADCRPGHGRTATLIPDGNGAAAVALMHGDALRADQELLSAISALVLGTVRRRTRRARLAAAMRQLEQSRRRIAEAADLERARIERDLHDGAQQRLMMLRIRLSLAEELLQHRPAPPGPTPSATWGTRPSGRSTSCAPWRTASIRRSSATAGWRRRCAAWRPGADRPAAPADGRAHPPLRSRSRPPSTSPASRRCRTRSSTRPTASAVWVRLHQGPTPCRSRCGTTAPASPPARESAPGPRSCTPGCATCATGSRPWADG